MWLIKTLLISISGLLSSRHRCAALGLPGRGVRPPGEHREVQQPPLRQEQERRLCAGGQLPAERAGPARGAARGLPLQLPDVAGAGGLLPAHPVGGPSAGPLTGPGPPRRSPHARLETEGKERLPCGRGCCDVAALVVAVAVHRRTARLSFQFRYWCFFGVLGDFFQL